MDSKKFTALVDELRTRSLDTLITKNEKYAGCVDDALHNFRAGAAFTGDSLARTCWGYLAKHLVALHDMVITNQFDDRDDFLEKCQDTVNYICILWAIGNEQREIMGMARAWEEGAEK